MAVQGVTRGQTAAKGKRTGRHTLSHNVDQSIGMGCKCGVHGQESEGQAASSHHFMVPKLVEANGASCGTSR